MPILPHEGLTLEALSAPIRLTVLQPAITASLLIALLKVQRRIVPQSMTSSTFGALVKTLKVLIPLGFLRILNNVLSQQVMNNWTTDQWRDGEEVVLVTGGASGIGDLLVRGLAGRAKAVIILDVTEPTQPLCMCP